MISETSSHWFILHPMHTLLTVPAAPAINFFPTAVDPVKVIFLTWIRCIKQEYQHYVIWISNYSGQDNAMLSKRREGWFKEIEEGCKTSWLASKASPISGAFPITTFRTPWNIEIKTIKNKWTEFQQIWTHIS